MKRIVAEQQKMLQQHLERQTQHQVQQQQQQQQQPQSHQSDQHPPKPTESQSHQQQQHNPSPSSKRAKDMDPKAIAEEIDHYLELFGASKLSNALKQKLQRALLDLLVHDDFDSFFQAQAGQWQASDLKEVMPVLLESLEHYLRDPNNSDSAEQIQVKHLCMHV